MKNLRRVCRRVAHPTFHGVSITMIVASFTYSLVAFMAGWEGDLVEVGEYCFLGWFGIEVGIRMHDHGWDLRKILADRWLIFDTVVIAIAAIPVVIDSSMLRMIRLPVMVAKLLHNGRHATHIVSHLRLAHLFRLGQ